MKARSVHDGDAGVEIVIAGSGQAQMAVADHVAMALAAAGAAVDYPGQRWCGPVSVRSLSGVRVVIRVGGKEQPHLLRGPGPSRRKFDWSTAGRIAIGLVLLLALFDAELRLRFGLKLDTVITAAAVWLFWVPP